MNTRAPFRVSIITVVRNEPAALASTIDSVRAQSYPSIEFVVVDGASTDGTCDVLRRNVTRIDKWLSEPDRGIYDAMNKAKALATGDFAMFVNAGDRFAADDVIERTMSQAQSKDVLYFGKVRLSDCTGRLSWEVPIVPSSRGAPPTSYLPHHQSIMYPRSFYAAHDYDTLMGYRADVHFTEHACRVLPLQFTNITVVESTLGGTSSRAIASLKQLREEFGKELAFARHVASTTGRRAPLIDTTCSVLVKYVASRLGGTPLVHRLMYAKHMLKSRLAEL